MSELSMQLQCSKCLIEAFQIYHWQNNIPKAQSKQKADLTAEKCGDVDDDADEEDGDDVPGEAWPTTTPSLASRLVTKFNWADTTNPLMVIFETLTSFYLPLTFQITFLWDWKQRSGMGEVSPYKQGGRRWRRTSRQISTQSCTRWGTLFQSNKW